MADDPVLITGAAGFIGFSLARRMLERGRAVVGIDSINAYYDPALKEARLAILRQFSNFKFHRIDVTDYELTDAVFAGGEFGPVVHLAAQAGVRYSRQYPRAYLDANLAGLLSVLEGCRRRNSQHLVYASSSSVYGVNARLPFSEHDTADHPISFYGATKRVNEAMARAYSHLYAIPATGLRFFTVYGPWGRPDMAMFLFAKAICEGQPIRLLNHGHMRRDFTYVDDVVEAMERLIDRPPAKVSAAGGTDQAGNPAAPWRIYNIGNNRAVEVSRVVELLEQSLGRKAKTELVPMQPGDVPETCANVDDLMCDVGFRPATGIEEGVTRFAAWYREFHAQN